MHDRSPGHPNQASQRLVILSNHDLFAPASVFDQATELFLGLFERDFCHWIPLCHRYGNRGGAYPHRREPGNLRHRCLS